MLLQELEIVKNERDELKQQKEQMAREHLNQTLNSNLDLKEENHILKEQDIIRNELLTRLEKEQERVTSEVSAFLLLKVFLVTILQRPERRPDKTARRV